MNPYRTILALTLVLATTGCEECKCDQNCDREYWLGATGAAPPYRLVITNRSDIATDCTMEQMTPLLPDTTITVIGTVTESTTAGLFDLTLLGYFEGDVRAERCGATPSYDSAAAVQADATLVNGDEVCVADQASWEWTCVQANCEI